MYFKSLIVAAAVVTGSLMLAGDASAITVNYNGLSGSSGFSYTEQGVRHRFYNSSFTNNGHWHRSGPSSDYYIWGHANCCSRRWIVDMNGTNFTMGSLRVEDDNNTFSWTGYLNGSVVWTAAQSGGNGSTFTFPTGVVDEVRAYVPSGGNFGWDDLVVNPCTPTADAGGPYTVAEGGTVAVSASGSSASGGTITGYNWDLDSGSGTGPFDDAATSSASFAAGILNGPGSTTVGVQVTCNGVLDDDQATVSVTNVPPTVSATFPTGGSEGSPVSFTSSVTDPGPDSHTYLWSFGDGNTSTQANPTHTYADDSTAQTNGSYAVTLTVDDGADTGTTSGTVTIANVAPTVAAMTGPTQGDEGSTLTFAGAGTDVGTVDAANLTYSWAWGDGSSPGSGTSPSHAWDDDDDNGGTNASPYTITLTVTDPQGATASSTITLTVDNVAPTINTSAPATALEGSLWSYQGGAADPGTDPLTWSLSASAPATMTVGSSTGLVEWTPVYADVGTASLTLTVDDGDGGTDVQTVTITVTFLDTDGDGLADTWETDNGLDPTIDDSGLDPDGDGLTNLDEFTGGTDPNVSDGPAVPVQTWPIGGEEVDDARPALAWDAASDPNGDVLTYDVEVYEDSAMAVLLTSTSGTSDLTFEVDTPLAENSDAYWRVRASDPYVAGTWSGLEAFFVNETNEAPGLPTALFPVDGETVAVPQPDAQMAEAVDVDRDALGYRIRVFCQDCGPGEMEVTQGWMPPGARDVSWTVDVELTEDTWYSWDAQAEDEHGLAGDWMEAEPFFVSSENAAPEDVHFIDPLDGDLVESTSPAFEATESVDPEGGELEYVFQIDTAAGFDSADLVSGVVEHNGSGSVVFDLDAEGETLTQNTTWNARVRAEDEAGIGSAWDVIEFFVRGDNDAPPTPALISPEDGTVLGEASPTVAVGHVEDPEGDTVFYSILVARDEALTDVLGSVDGLVAGAGPQGTVDQATWQLTARVNGTFYWSARAIDEHGAASDWAEAWSFSFDDTDPVPPPVEEGCDCESSLASSSTATGWAALLFLLIPALRRRRS